MRLSSLAILAGWAARGLAEEEANPVKPSTFNGKTVPPLKELTPANWEEEIKKNKFLMVKHYRYADIEQTVIPLLTSYQSLL
jgi:protein disulfide-isomerase